MAIEDLIANGITGPEGPAESMGKVMSLRNMMMANQINKEKLIGDKLANKQAQDAVRDDDAWKADVLSRYGAQSQQGGTTAAAMGAPPPVQAPQQWQPADGGPNTSSAMFQGAPPAAGVQYTAPPQPGLGPNTPATRAGYAGAPGADWRADVDRANRMGQPKRAAAIAAAGVANDEKMAMASKDTGEANHFDIQTKVARTGAIADAMQGVLAMSPDQQPAAYAAKVQTLVQQGYLKPSEVEPFPGTEALAGHYASLKAHQEQLTATATANEETRKAALAPSVQASAEAKATTDGVNADQMTALGMTKDQRETLDGAATGRQQTERHNRVDEAQGAQRVGIAGAELGISREREKDNHAVMQGVTDEATLDLMTKAVASGVPISQVVRGRGNAADATVKQVLSRIANNPAYPNFNLGQALADYKGQSGAVVDMTKTLASMNGLEKVAGKNLDYALDTFSKLPDTGSKLMNIPIRMLNDKLMGSGPQAEALTALVGASRETARMVNNFGGKGELTDSARHAVDKLGNDPNMTLSEYMGFVKAIKTDMANVKNGYSQGLEDARNKIGANAGKPAAAPAGAPAAEVKVKDPGGHVHTFKTQADADGFKKAAGIQ